MKTSANAHNYTKTLENYMFTYDNFTIKFSNIKDKPTISNDSDISFNKINIISEKVYSPKVDDTLFWCFYYIKNNEEDDENWFKKEKQFKINFVEIIRKNKELAKKYKIKVIDIENELVNENKISKLSLLALCLYYEINILLVEGNVYYKLIGNENDSIKYAIILNSKCYELLFINSIDKYIENKFEAVKINKIINVASYYKSEELKNIASLLNISIDKKNKKQLYEDILTKIYQ